jgi:hypothetical protein
MNGPHEDSRRDVGDHQPPALAEEEARWVLAIIAGRSMLLCEHEIG